jgi:hypothetical protein
VAIQLAATIAQLVPEIRMRDLDQGFAPLPECLTAKRGDSIFSFHIVHIVS